MRKRGRLAKRSPKPIEDEIPEMKEEEQVSDTAETKIYWAPAKNYALYLSKRDPEMICDGQFQKERRDMRGNVINPATPIKFGSNMLVTDESEVQEVVENSNAFKTGEIVICKSLSEANNRSKAKHLEKVVTSGMKTITDETSQVNTVEDASAAIRG